MEQKPMSAKPRFKSPEAEASFVKAYEASLALWPVAHETAKVSTSYGETHLNMAGSLDLPALVLLHGAQISSPVWYANIEALSRHFRVYAPDVVDQMGLSIPSRKLQAPQDYSNWLCEVMDVLGIEKASLLGHSQGGWQAINMAIQKPERVEKLVLLAPAPAIAQMRIQVILRMLPVFVRPTRATFRKYLQWMTRLELSESHPIVEQFFVGAMAYTAGELSFGATTVFTDDELGKIKSPSLLLVGEHEVVYEPKKVLERAKRLIPKLETEIIRGGGHLFPVDQAEVTNSRILEFLRG
jgi:pimeloyl-ACP methyl ester carboxylesterase